MKLKKAFLLVLLGVLLYAWTMIVAPAVWAQVLKTTGPIQFETTYKWGEKSLWREPFQKVMPKIMVPTIVWGQGGNEIGFGLYPPNRPVHAASEKMNVQEPLFLGWENTPKIVLWHRDEMYRIWWGNPIHWELIGG